MTRTAHALAVALTLAACAPEFALQRPTTIRCTCTCDHERKPCTAPEAAPTRAPARATPAPAPPSPTRVP
jgi:hypothetical protein